jgi:hypothetical protein
MPRSPTTTTRSIRKHFEALECLRQRLVVVDAPLEDLDRDRAALGRAGQPV